MASCAALRALAVLVWVAAAYPVVFRARPVDGLAVNWGTRALHPLPGEITVRLLRDNGFDKVKLFEADPNALRALGHSGLQVMVGLPNELLAGVAGSVNAAEQWVLQNVSTYISKYGVDIRYTHQARSTPF